LDDDEEEEAKMGGKNTEWLSSLVSRCCFVVVTVNKSSTVCTVVQFERSEREDVSGEGGSIFIIIHHCIIVYRRMNPRPQKSSSENGHYSRISQWNLTVHPNNDLLEFLSVQEFADTHAISSMTRRFHLDILVASVVREEEGR
jgi:hypothetical protein